MRDELDRLVYDLFGHSRGEFSILGFQSDLTKCLADREVVYVLIKPNFEKLKETLSIKVKAKKSESEVELGTDIDPSKEMLSLVVKYAN